MGQAGFFVRREINAAADDRWRFDKASEPFLAHVRGMTRILGSSRSAIVASRRVRRPDLCRRHPRPARSQRLPHRSRRRQPPAQTLPIDHKGLTAGPQLATKLRSAGRPPARRHHLGSPGDIISESAGDFVGICIARLSLRCAGKLARIG